MHKDDLVTIELEIDKVNVILAALSEAPYKHAAPVIEQIHKQVSLQLKEDSGDG